MTDAPLSPQGQAALAALARAFRLSPGVLVQDPMGAALADFVARRDPYGIAPENPVRTIKTRVGDRWSSLILQVLGFGPLGHARLRRVVGALSSEGEISQRMLTLRLRELERDGLVARQVTPSVPPRVDYSLTPLGQGLLDQMMHLIAWVEANHATIHEARARFDAEADTDLPGRWY